MHVAIISVVVPLRPPGLQSNKTEGERVSEGEKENEAEKLKENKRGTVCVCVCVQLHREGCSPFELWIVYAFMFRSPSLSLFVHVYREYRILRILLWLVYVSAACRKQMASSDLQGWCRQST